MQTQDRKQNKDIQYRDKGISNQSTLNSVAQKEEGPSTEGSRETEDDTEVKVNITRLT